jgi:hypothetical protein
MPITGYMSGCLGSVARTFDAATVSWVAQVVTNGGSVSLARETVVDDLIRGLKVDGLWTRLDRLWVLAAANSQSALTDLVGLTLATVTNAPTFTTDRGYACNGTTSFIDTQFNASTQGVQYTLNSSSQGCWAVTFNTLAAQTRAFGTATATFTAETGMTTTDQGAGTGNTIGHVNDATGTSVVSIGATGMFSTTRNNSTNIDMYFNTTNISVNASSASVSIPSATTYIGGRNKIGTGLDAGSNQQVGMLFLGAGFSAFDITNMYNHMRAYMTAVGVP